MSKLSNLLKARHSITVSSLIALLIFGAGAIGLTYYTNHTPLSSQGIRALQARRVSTTTPVTTTNSFTIPELGIKLTLPNGLTPGDLQYDAQVNRPVTAADTHPWSTLSFTTKSLLQLDSGCTAAEGSIGIIGRLTEDPKAIKAEVQKSLPLGNYYFDFAAPQGSCSMNPNAQQLERAQVGLLQQAFDTISGAN